MASKFNHITDWIPLAVVLFILGAAVSCERWRYRECRKVGHSTLYCVLQIGEKK